MPELNSNPGHIILLTDRKNKTTKIHNLLSLTCFVRTCDLSELKFIKFKNVLFIAVSIDLSNRQTLLTMEKFLKLTNRAGVSTLFVLNDYSGRDILQLRSLGGTDYITQPVNHEKLKPFIQEQTEKACEKEWRKLPPVQIKALKRSLTAFDQMISNAARGYPLDTTELEESSQLIIEAATNDHLVTWVSALANHHNSSFRHCLTTCGYFVGFAHELGIRNADLQKVALAGLVHDIGKCKIPTAILNKPSAPSPDELKEIKKHPTSGRNILLNSPQEWDEDIIDAVHHHHENLDGSGYPDGLKGAQISNMTLLLTITDVFSALTEQRAYREAMAPDRAYEVMCSMDYKFDAGLLKAFKPMALITQEQMAA